MDVSEKIVLLFVTLIVYAKYRILHWNIFQFLATFQAIT